LEKENWVMTTNQALNGWGGAGVRQEFLEGTDLELVHNLQGDDLVLRVNKAGVLVFRAMLRDAVPPLLETRLLNFNSLAPDLVFTIGDSEEGLRRMLRAAGMDGRRPGAASWPGCGGRHEGDKPALIAYAVKDPLGDERKAIWTRIGGPGRTRTAAAIRSAWMHVACSASLTGFDPVPEK
jgi:hypothetical protein